MGQVQPGGSTNSGLIRRVGDTVERPAKSGSAAVAALLEHLEAKRFAGAPRHLGFGPPGLERLSFVDGQVHSANLPGWISAPECLRAVAGLLRSFHDAAADLSDAVEFRPPLDPPAELAGHQPSHGDLGYGNVVFDERHPLALIDFEFACRADVLLDLATLASQWPLVARSADEVSDERHEQMLAGIRAAIHGYGATVEQRVRLPDALVLVEERAARWTRSMADAGHAPSQAAVAGGVLERRAFRAGYLARSHSDISRALAVDSNSRGASVVAEPTDLADADVGMCGWAGGPAHVAAIRAALDRRSQGETDYLVVRDRSGRPIAKAGIDYAATPGDAVIWQVATHPEHEGRGLATALVRAAEARARARGCAAVRLGVEPANVRARQLYLHLGFSPAGHEEDAWTSLDLAGNEAMHETVCEILRKPLG